MDAPAPRRRRGRILAGVALASAAALVATLPAAAFSGDWTKPRRVFAGPVAAQSMVTDEAGAVHVAVARGRAGVWYVSNQGGSWSQCRVSSADDRQPSIAVSGGTVHIAFARATYPERGIYTASGEPAAGEPDCGLPLERRSLGPAGHPSLVARGSTLSIAYRTADGKLRFTRGGAGAAGAWSLNEVIDGSCCTSPVALALTHTGSPRVAYGDGRRSAAGLKLAVRTGNGRWKKSKAHGGRVIHVAMVLDQTPGLFGQPPSNAPHIAYVVRRQGTFHAVKGGGWSRRDLGRSFGPLDLTYHSNLLYIVHARNGDLRYTRASGGIWYGGTLSGSGKDGQPQLSGALTFTRKGPSGGVYYTRAK